MPRGDYKVRLKGGPAAGKEFSIYRQEETLEVEQGGKKHIYRKTRMPWESHVIVYEYERTKR